MMRRALSFFALVTLGLALSDAYGTEKKKGYVPQVRFEAPIYHNTSGKYRGEQFFLTSIAGQNPHGSKHGVTTAFHGLKASNQVLAPEWADIVITPTVLFGKRERSNATYVRIPIEKTKKGWKSGAPVPTPYVEIRPAHQPSFTTGQNHVWLGVRPGEDALVAVDVLDEEMNPTATLSRLAKDFPTGVAQFSDTTIGGFFVDEAGDKVLGILDRSGAFVAPPLPKVTQFKPSSDYHAPPYFLFAVPLDEEGVRWRPLRPDGTIPIEPTPVKGHHKLHPKTEFIHAWIKEYDEDGASMWGWTTPDLATETGPVWRSIVKREAPHAHYLAQLRDGTWMAYVLEEKKLGRGVTAFMPAALLETPMPTAESVTGVAIIQAFGRRQLEVLKRPEHNQRAAPAPWRWYLSASDLATRTELEKIDAAQLERAVQRKDWSAAENYARGLGGDHWVFFHVAQVNYTNRPFGTSAFWHQLAAQAQDAKLRNEATAIAEKQAYDERLAEAEFRRYRVWQEGQESLRASQATAGLKAWLLAGGGMTMPSAAQPSYAERSAATQRYMTAFDNYQRGRQTWKPAAPEHLK